jgi:hypothetical protein
MTQQELKEKLSKAFQTQCFRLGFIHCVFLEKDDGDVREIQRLKDQVLNEQYLDEIEDISKNYYNGKEGVHLILLKNGEWFEVGARVWSADHKILESSSNHKETFQRFLKGETK